MIFRNGPLMDTRSRESVASRRRGLTMIEALLMMVILGIVAVGVGTGMQSAFMLPKGTERAVAISTELRSEAENWRAVAFKGSTWPGSLPYSLTDTVTISIQGQNTTLNRTTSIQNWDPNNLSSNTSPQADFVRIQITIDGNVYVIYLTNPS